MKANCRPPRPRLVLSTSMSEVALSRTSCPLSVPSTLRLALESAKNFFPSTGGRPLEVLADASVTSPAARLAPAGRLIAASVWSLKS